MLLLRVTFVGVAITCNLICFHVRVVKTLRGRWINTFAADVAAFGVFESCFHVFPVGGKRS